MTDTTKLRELLEKATREEWTTAPAESARTDDECAVLVWLDADGEPTSLDDGDGVFKAADAALIVAMHTALPSLLDAADERDAMRVELAERIEINSRNVAAVCAQRDALAERLDEMTRQRDAAAEDAEQ
jgi:hypothetical protein